MGLGLRDNRLARNTHTCLNIHPGNPIKIIPGE